MCFPISLIKQKTIHPLKYKKKLIQLNQLLSLTINLQISDTRPVSVAVSSITKDGGGGG